MPTEFTLTIPDKLAENLKGLEQPLKADIIVILEALNWNIHGCANSIGAEVESSDTDYAKIRGLADEMQALATACNEIERDELPTTYPRPVEEAR